MSGKKCFKCQAVKSLSEFYRHAMMADGHLNKCKTCTKTDVAQHRLENIDAVRQYDRDRAKLPARKAASAKIASQWRDKHPERRSAQVALGNALSRGIVLQWPCCAVPECVKRPEAHHPDYSQPLSVVWLCCAHHAQAHALTRKLRR